ncbi:MAG: T9SS type A sorting domain-containing protein, partial [Firmicutes bacterium]|nr:T9SS type A sorting domain-containing protein [Bacillota bacterium]
NVTSSPTATVTKATQTAPAAPTLSSSTTSSITLNTITGCEYRRDNGNWQTSTVFSGLTPNTTYSFKARKSETVTHLASPESPGATFKTDEEVGINENQFENITVYPNPTTGILRIESRELRVEKIEIFDVFGRKLLSLLSPTSPETTVDISHLSAGVYFVKVSTEIGEAIKKVLKE